MGSTKNDAPELEEFFRTMNRVSALNYCVVCLRTDTERTLAVSRYLKKFATAVKIDNEWQNHQTCFMCERQAANALKFYTAAVFASSVHKMFEDLILFKKKGFYKAHFIKALKKISKGTSFEYPSEWEAQLMFIRRRTQMSETEPLVIDTQRVKPKSTLTPHEVIVIPDDSTGQVTATATRSCGITVFPDNSERLTGRKRLMERLGTKNGRTSSNKMSTDDSFMLSSSQPKVSETFVILEDEDEQDPLQLRIENVKSDNEQTPQTPRLPTLRPKPNDPINRPQPVLTIVPDRVECQPVLNIVPGPSITGPQSHLTIVPDRSITGPQSHLTIVPDRPITGPQSHLTIVPDRSITAPQSHLTMVSAPSITGPQSNLTMVPAPSITGPQSHLNMVPIEKLLEQPKPPDNSLVVNNNTDMNFIVHPIILSDGLLTVPSLAATIVNGVLTIQAPAEPRENNMLKELIQNPAKEIVAPTNNVLCQTDLPRQYPKSSILLNTETQLAKSKRDYEFMFATPSKKVKGLPVIESVTSEPIKSDRIDWEDKIPMDVISFMDALDPNPPKFMDANTTPNIGPLGVESQVQCTQTPVDPNVIDLC